MDLKKIVEDHKIYLLEGYMPKCADLSGANLSGANLSGANLSCANLFSAKLSSAKLFSANLSCANLSSSNLSSANLSSSNLSGASLFSANLSGADLSSANLSGANLSCANLFRADLSSANLSGANLYGADLSEAKLGSFTIVPEIGQFIVFKKLKSNNIAKLLVLKSSKRLGGLIGRKCRVSKVKVLEISGNLTEDFDRRTGNLLYQVGKIVIPDKFDDDIRLECTNGIHCFLTRKEAEEYYD